MKYIKVHASKPRSDVFVLVITESGKKGIAKYWHETKIWITDDADLMPYDKVIKWKYADATIINKELT